MQRKIHLSLMAWFSIFATALVLSPSSAAAKSSPVTDCVITQASISTEKEGADSFIEVALSASAYFRSDLNLLPSGLTNANVSKAKLRLFVGGMTAPGSLDVFLFNFGTCGDHTVGSVLAAIPFALPSDLPTRADVFAGEGE